MTFEEMDILQDKMNRFLQRYPLLPERMKTTTWHMPGLLGLDKYEFENRYGKGVRLSSRQGVIVQLNHIRKHQKEFIEERVFGAHGNVWEPSYTSMWNSTASAMGRLFLLNRPELADKVYRYMEELCKKT